MITTKMHLLVLRFFPFIKILVYLVFVCCIISSDDMASFLCMDSSESAIPPTQEPSSPSLDLTLAAPGSTTPVTDQIDKVAKSLHNYLSDCNPSQQACRVDTLINAKEELHLAASSQPRLKALFRIICAGMVEGLSTRPKSISAARKKLLEEVG
jgi:hypothetical protein